MFDSNVTAMWQGTPYPPGTGIYVSVCVIDVSCGARYVHDSGAKFSNIQFHENTPLKISRHYNPTAYLLRDATRQAICPCQMLHMWRRASIQFRSPQSEQPHAIPTLPILWSSGPNAHRSYQGDSSRVCVREWRNTKTSSWKSHQQKIATIYWWNVHS